MSQNPSFILVCLAIVALGGPLAGATEGVGLDMPSDVAEVVFALRQPSVDGHWYGNLGYYADWNLNKSHFRTEYHHGKRVAYRPGGKLCVLDVQTGEVRTLVDDPLGGVRDPAVHPDGQTILFSYRKGDSEHFHLYTIQADGTRLEQLTRGPFDDIEPCWLPDGDIAFVSTRSRRWVSCWTTQVATIHRCRPDGTHIQVLSANPEHDNTPWPLPDGRLLYQRWEYVDRSQVHYHHLWTMNPDGSNQTVYFGNQTPGILMIDAKPIHGTDQVLAIFSPGHGQRDHDGWVTVVDPGGGPDEQTKARRIHNDQRYRDPFPLTPKIFLTAHGTTVQLMNEEGKTRILHELSPDDRQAGLEAHEPRPLRAEPRAPVLPSHVDPAESVGRLVLADIHEGRNMAGVRRGEIKKLLVLEVLPKPINYTGGMDPMTYAGSFSLERVLGTVPVEPDGSAYLELPALRSLFFVALDENDLSVKRMQSFLTVMPGETTSCVGCHEQRTHAVSPQANLLALRRGPSSVEPVADCPDVFDFPRDIQPVLDRLCVDCHGYEQTPRGGPYAGDLILSGDRGPMFSHSYYQMTVNRLFSDGRNLPKSNYPPRTLGTSASEILTMLDGSHYDVQANEHEKRILRLWIEVGAPYPGTYAALGCGSIGGYFENKQVHTDYQWPQTKAAGEVISRRCESCHQGERVLPKAISDEIGLSFWQPNMNDPRLKMSRHILFNLSKPERSLILLAPLSKQAGGWGICSPMSSETEGATTDEAFAVFGDQDDDDFQKILSMCLEGKRYLETIGRFDMPGFRPREPYVREMKRFGVLSADFDAASQTVDPYVLDQRYWRSLWHTPKKPPVWPRQ